MIRIFDFLFSFFGLLVLSPVLLILFAITYFDTGSPLFRQERIGRFEEPFTLVKFRTMQFNTASVASHLVDKSAITPIGSFLRKSHLDELPQLWNVLKGNMSLVGARPALFSQEKLRDARKKHDVYRVRPGITGLSQVTGHDMSDPKLLSKIDAIYPKIKSIKLDVKILFATITGIFRNNLVEIVKKELKDV